MRCRSRSSGPSKAPTWRRNSTSRGANGSTEVGSRSMGGVAWCARLAQLGGCYQPKHEVGARFVTAAIVLHTRAPIGPQLLRGERASVQTHLPGHAERL